MKYGAVPFFIRVRKYIKNAEYCHSNRFHGESNLRPRKYTALFIGLELIYFKEDYLLIGKPTGADRSIVALIFLLRWERTPARLKYRYFKDQVVFLIFLLS